MNRHWIDDEAMVMSTISLAIIASAESIIFLFLVNNHSLLYEGTLHPLNP